MNDWWSRKLGIPEPVARRDPGPAGAWWQTPPPLPKAPAAPPAPAHDLAALRKKPATELTAEEMDALATAGLAAQARNACPHCGSENYVSAGTRIGSQVMPSKCFECGGTSSPYASSPEPAPAGRGGGGQPARQIDTGGAAGSMFMKFDGLPAGYRPRGG